MTFYTFVRYMPLWVNVIGLVGIAVTYATAVLLNHVSPIWPYLSETGAYPPESCIFTLNLTFMAFMGYIVVYVRYLEVHQIKKVSPEFAVSPTLHCAAIFFGVLSMFGIQLVGCFPYYDEYTTHLIVSILAFVSAFFYYLLQTVISFKTDPESQCLLLFRIIINCVMGVLLFTTFIPLYFSLKKFQGEDRMKWGPDDGGYELHLLSTISEWFLVGTIIVYTMTFLHGFTKFDIKEPELKFKYYYNKQETPPPATPPRQPPPPPPPPPPPGRPPRPRP